MKDIVIDLNNPEKIRINVIGYESFDIYDKRLLEELIEWAFVQKQIKEAE